MKILVEFPGWSRPGRRDVCVEDKMRMDVYSKRGEPKRKTGLINICLFFPVRCRGTVLLGAE
jgi:hypothetical protein